MIVEFLWKIGSEIHGLFPWNFKNFAAEYGWD